MRCCRCAAPAAGKDIDLCPGSGGTRAQALSTRRCVLDLKQESDALYAGYLGQAIHFSLAGFLALTVLLLIALRSPLRVARVLAPLVLAVLTVAAALALSGVQLTILHLVGMLLIVAVGSNYALFFDRQANSGDHGGEALTLASLVIANASTVIGFGLLVLLAGAGAGRVGHHRGARRISRAAVRGDTATRHGPRAAAGHA